MFMVLCILYIHQEVAVCFEYDQRKSDANNEKHGIDFEEAQALWDGDMVAYAAHVKGERRWKGIGRIDGEYWAAIYTERHGKTRIISVRPATATERSSYDRCIND